MKIAVLNFGFGNTTVQCCDLLREQLSKQDVEVYQMNEIAMTDLPQNFDVYVLGCSIHRFSVSKKMRRFLKHNGEKLKNKRFFLFMCCGYVDQYEDYLKANFEEEFLQVAEGVSCFGGQLKTEAVSGFDKVVIYFMRRRILDFDPLQEGEYTRVLPCIEVEEIRRMTDRIRGVFRA